MGGQTLAWTGEGDAPAAANPKSYTANEGGVIGAKEPSMMSAKEMEVPPEKMYTKRDGH